MSKKLTPLQQIIKDISADTGNTKEAQILISKLKEYLPVEKQFAEDAFNAGIEHEASPPFGAPDFATYFETYKNEGI